MKPTESSTNNQYASLLISRLPLPSSPPPSIASSKSKALYSAISLLSFSLSNVKRETDFFVQTALEHGLDLRPNGFMPVINEGNGLGEYKEVTRSYVDLLWGVGAGGSLEEGLVLLWAMEKVCTVYQYGWK
jgi:hypothetical protein